MLVSHCAPGDPVHVAVDGWLDMAKLVAGGGATKTPYDEFASAIGEDGGTAQTHRRHSRLQLAPGR